MEVVSYCYYERGAQNECALPKYFYSFSTAELNIISENEVFAHEFSCEESDF